MKVSVIIPMYNLENYIEKCVRSVLEQTYPNLEIIIVNDGSQDGCLAVCEKLAKQDNRIKIFSQENKGVSAARNLGIQNASGQYMAFVDGDDILHPQAIELALGDFTKGNVVLSVFECEIINVQDEKPEKLSDSVHSQSCKEFLKLLLKWETNTSACGKLYREDIAKTLSFEEGKKINEDRDFVVQYLLKSDGEVFSHSAKTYRILERIGSAGRTSFDKRYYSMLYFADKITASVQREAGELYGEAVYNEIITKLMFLKYIIRAKKYKQEKSIFKQVKKEILQAQKNLKVIKTGKHKMELIALKAGDVFYKGFVNFYDKVHKTKIYR